MRLNKNMTWKGFVMGTLEYEAMSNPNLLWPFPGKFGLSDWDYFLLIIQSRRHLSSGFMFNRREELGFVNLTLEELVFVNLSVQHLKKKKKHWVQSWSVQIENGTGSWWSKIIIWTLEALKIFISLPLKHYGNGWWACTIFKTIMKAYDEHLMNFSTITHKKPQLWAEFLFKL